MPLIKSPSKKAFSKNVEIEMEAGKPQKQSLAIAFAVKRKNARKKMAEGGEVDLPNKSEQEQLDSMDSQQDSMDADKKESYKADDEWHPPMKMADEIYQKRKMAMGGEVDEREPGDSLDELNEDAFEDPIYDESQLSAQPEDSNEIGDLEEKDSENKLDKVEIIRRKMRSMRG